MDYVSRRARCEKVAFLLIASVSFHVMRSFVRSFARSFIHLLYPLIYADIGDLSVVVLTLDGVAPALGAGWTEVM